MIGHDCLVGCRPAVGLHRIDCPNAVDSRKLVLAAEDAREALMSYARLLFKWNAPDDEHTRIQLRRLVEEVVANYGKLP